MASTSTLTASTSSARTPPTASVAAAAATTNSQSSTSGSAAGNTNGQSTSALTSSSASAPPTVVHYNSKTVRCRIDRGVPIDEIIRQLCASPQLAVNEPSSLFALRDSADNELLTAENINRKLDNKASFNLVPSPTIEAADSVDRLVGGDKQAIKAATFALKAFVRVG